MELKEGQVYKRIKGPNVAFTVGKLYPVRIDENGVPFIVSDSGAPWYSGEIIDDRFELAQDNKGDKDMEYTFKDGQVYEYVANDCYPFDRGQHLTVQSDDTSCYIFSKGGTRWYAYDFNEGDLRLVEEPTPDPHADLEPVLINVENLMEHIVTNKLEVNEILSYLGGYMEGARF